MEMLLEVSPGSGWSSPSIYLGCKGSEIRSQVHSRQASSEQRGQDKLRRISLASPCLLEQLPHLWQRRRAPAGLLACGAVCWDPPLLCGLGEVTGALRDRFPHAKGVASISHSVLSCPEDLLLQENKEPSTEEVVLAGDAAGPVRK